MGGYWTERAIPKEGDTPKEAATKQRWRLELLGFSQNASDGENGLNQARRELMEKYPLDQIEAALHTIEKMDGHKFSRVRLVDGTPCHFHHTPGHYLAVAPELMTIDDRDTAIRLLKERGAITHVSRVPIP